MRAFSVTLLLPLLTLAACGQGTSPSNEFPTALSAKVDGHPVAAAQTPTAALAYFDTTLGTLNFVATTDRGQDTYEQIGLTLWHFSGPGRYDLHLNQASGGSAYYTTVSRSGSAPGLAYEAHGGPADVAQVTSYNAGTGRIVGTFSFTGVNYLTGDSVTVTQGHFSARVRPQ